MILNTFTKDEIARGIDSVVREFCNSSMPTGLGIKYDKALHNRKVKDGTILGVHKYTIDSNLVYVVVTKRTYNYSPRKHGEMVFNYYVTITNPNTGRVSYGMPCFNAYGDKIEGYSVLTEHFLQRLKERAGMEFVDMLKQYGSASNPVIIKEDGKIETTWGGHRLFGYQYEDGKYTYITTMVTDDMLFETQLPAKEEMENIRKKYEDYKNSVNTI